MCLHWYFLAHVFNDSTATYDKQPGWKNEWYYVYNKYAMYVVALLVL